MTLRQFIWGFVRGQWVGFAAILLPSLVLVLETLFWPFFLKEIVDILARFDGDRVSVWPHLKPLLMWGAVMWVVMEGGFRLRDYFQALVFPSFQARMRMAMFDHVQRHSPKYFNEHFSGSLANKIGDMITAATMMVRSTLILFIPTALIALFTVFVFSRISGYFALIVGTWIVVHMLLWWRFTSKCAEYANQHGEVRSHLVGKIVDSLTNNFAVNLFYRFAYEKKVVGGYQEEELKAHKKAEVYTSKMFCWLALALAVETFALMGFMIFFWIGGAITTGEVVQLFYTVWNVSLVFFMIANAAPEFMQSLGVAKQALELMHDPQDIADAPEAKELVVRRGEIVFENVSFRYGERQIFQNKTLHISAGERVGLVGYSGAGKSTFVNLILRFYPLEKGRILIDGQDISQVTLASLREQIALIPQDTVLFHRSLEENIRYGRIEASEGQILEAAKLAHCDEFIQKTAQGYQTLVGERGTKLSGGEKQRIVIARAMLLQAPILLLDEATAALDSVTERYIQESLERLMENRTTIVVAHRLSTLAKMDRILVFDQGKVIEEGSHHALLAQKGHYAHMWQMQAGGFLPDRPV